MLTPKNLSQFLLCIVAFCSPGVVIGLWQVIFWFQGPTTCASWTGYGQCTSIFIPLGTTQKLSGVPAEVVARALGGSLAIPTPELMKGPPLLLVGCWSSSRWVASGWWALRREKSIISFKLANHCPASWRGENMKLWMNPACDLLLLGPELRASPYSSSSLQPHLPSPCPQTVCHLSFLMPQRPRVWLAFSPSFFHSFATRCISIGHLWQKPKKTNIKLQCASYSLVPSTSLKKKEGCHRFGNLPKHSANLSNSSFWWQYTIFKHWCFI